MHRGYTEEQLEPAVVQPCPESSPGHLHRSCLPRAWHATPRRGPGAPKVWASLGCSGCCFSKSPRHLSLSVHPQICEYSAAVLSVSGHPVCVISQNLGWSIFLDVGKERAVLDVAGEKLRRRELASGSRDGGRGREGARPRGALSKPCDAAGPGRHVAVVWVCLFRTASPAGRGRFRGRRPASLVNLRGALSRSQTKLTESGGKLDVKIGGRRG